MEINEVIKIIRRWRIKMDMDWVCYDKSFKDLYKSLRKKEKESEDGKTSTK